MAAVVANLTLAVPGLLGPFPPEVERTALPRLFQLERLLSRAAVVSRTPAAFEHELFALFGIVPDAAGALPAAAVSRLGEGNPRDARYWLRADPVHLAPNQDKLYLVAADALALQSEEADALAEQCRVLCGGRFVALEVHEPHRWYLGLSEPLSGSTLAPLSLLGADVHPQQPPSAALRAFATELQMVLHSHQVNEMRLSGGLLPANSLWLWGGGTLPDEVHGPFDAVHSGEPLARGLATLGGIPLFEVPASAEELFEVAAERSLVVLDGLRPAAASGDLPRYRKVAEAMEANWWEPLLAALTSGRLGRLELRTGTGSFALRRADLRRFWRRRRPLEAFTDHV